MGKLVKCWLNILQNELQIIELSSIKKKYEFIRAQRKFIIEILEIYLQKTSIVTPTKIRICLSKQFENEKKDKNIENNEFFKKRKFRKSLFLDNRKKIN